MSLKKETPIPVGTKALILSKFYYGVLSKSLENIDVERYYAALYFLSQNNGCNQQCICNNLAIDKTAMVKVIDYLMKADMVERDINPQDRREHFIKLTKKGLKQTEEIVKAFTAIDTEIFSNISKEDQETFTKVLSQLSSNLKNLPANDLFFNYKKTKRKRTTTFKTH
ncbi:MAG: MarR family transcriptional regulator [Bacteroidetes bacterium]|nr:MarR family transcriptional regulator [Bacteroidota bacterium]